MNSAWLESTGQTGVEGSLREMMSNIQYITRAKQFTVILMIMKICANRFSIQDCKEIEYSVDIVVDIRYPEELYP